MSIADALTIAQLNPDGSVPVPEAPDAKANAAAAALEQAAQLEALQAQMADLQEVLSKPLAEILADHERFKKTAAAWDAFGAMWMLSQRAMRRVAMDLAEPQGVGEADVVARAMAYANAVLNGEEVDLNGSIAPAQMAHIARHTPALRPLGVKFRSCVCRAAPAQASCARCCAGAARLCRFKAGCDRALQSRESLVRPAHR